MSRSWKKGRYFYDFHENIKKLKQECFICGVSKDIEPHHIRKVKKNNPQYSDTYNIVMLCHRHHNMYHQSYKKTNQKTFAEFVKKCNQKRINQLTDQLGKSNAELKRTKNKLKNIENMNLRGYINPDTYENFIKLYNAGFTVVYICEKLNIGSTRYYKLFQKAKTEKSIELRGRGKRENIDDYLEKKLNSRSDLL